jgi:hypothetical protein
MKDLAELPALISAEKQVLVQERVIEIWDGLGCLLVFLLAVCAEWSLRKLWGLL